MIHVETGSRKLLTQISLDSSKSITNRILIIQSLSTENFKLVNASDADDSKILKDILDHLTPEIDVKEAGTAYRFLTAYLSIQMGEYVLTGNERMHKRPIGKLVDALRMLGAEISYLGDEGFPPLKIKGKKLKGGKITIDASESSQFISSLLLIGPVLSGGLEIELSGKMNSFPYITMTVSLMKHFGVDVSMRGNVLFVPQMNYKGADIIIENDWSSASFWYQAAALSEASEIVLKNQNVNSIQGDVRIADIMKQFNVKSIQSGNNVILKKHSSAYIPSAFSYDFSDCPDLVIPVAFTCAALRVPALFSGVKNLRIKESDRLNGLREELGKAGALVKLLDDTFSIHPIDRPSGIPSFKSYGDHRMVMAEAMLSLVFESVSIDTHLPVSKSYSQFWEHLKQSGFTCTIT